MFYFSLVFITWISQVLAIFEDQVGKFDWRNQYIGCSKQLVYQRSYPTHSDYIYILSEANVVAAVKATTGNIAWRQTLEVGQESGEIFVHNQLIISTSRNESVVRAWERRKGLFVWEAELPNFDSAKTITATTSSVIILGKLAIYSLSTVNGQIRWSYTLEDSAVWLGVVIVNKFAVIVGTSTSAIKGFKLELSTGRVESATMVEASWKFHRNKCLLVDDHFMCFDDKGLYAVNVDSDSYSIQEIVLPGITEINRLKVSGIVAVNTAKETYIYEIKHGTVAPVLTLEKAYMITAVKTHDDKTYIASFIGHTDAMKKVMVIELSQKTSVFAGILNDTYGRRIKDVILAIAGREFELVVVSDDCRIDLYVSTNGGEMVSEWSRHEALSAIASAEFVDLPLSEAQAGIESEFASSTDSFLHTLGRRMVAQLNQISRGLVSAASDVFFKNSFLKVLLGWAPLLGVSENDRREQPLAGVLERDYFNLRKIIVATTHKPIIYGLDSADGSILWSLYLGSDMIPLTTSLGVESVPLFIQRTTANYRYAPQAAVVFANKFTTNGIIVLFNPVTGGFIEKISLNTPIRRVEMLPFTAVENLHPLLVIDTFDEMSLIPNVKIDLLSPVPEPTYLFFYDVKGHLEGFQLEMGAKKLVQRWKSNLALLSSQKVVAVIGKPMSQRVHSSGRVLGDRSVLYKYSNPNLVAVVTFDKEHSSLHIHLIDAVNGYNVYSAKQNKVSEPFYFVHCENWFTYSYWNEKARRTEIAVIELYEGLKQTSELTFSSLTPVVSPVINAVSQAYIFPQGVTAMGVTDTEQGLSTRSILIAMPFGGLYGISKRMLDARRPLEVTAQFAEEMLIPYRPELPLLSEDFINYNQTVLQVRGIKAAPSGLESTSLVFAYGLDLFFTRMTPSGTFDILKDDFDHKLITVVLVSLIIACFICRKIGRSRAIKQAWQ